jgi:hypothetical protein
MPLFDVSTIATGLMFLKQELNPILFSSTVSLVVLLVVHSMIWWLNTIES